jgi:hypothetical protein
MRALIWLAIATLTVIVTINAWLIIQLLRAARRAVAVPAQMVASRCVGSDAHRAAGGFGGAWVETHSTQKSMKVRILRDRYLRLT